MIQLTLTRLTAETDIDLGASQWITVDQSMIDTFADATGDRAWIHVDPARAARGPFRGTIAHGFMGLSMLPFLLDRDLLKIVDSPFGLNYGVDHVRFTVPVPVGSRVRAHGRISSTEQRGASLLVRIPMRLELEGSERPAVVCEMLGLFGTAGAA
jgi:acyl dehydratase